MKKVTGLLAVLALTAALFSGCQSKDVTIDVVALADDLKNSVPFVDTLDEPSNVAFSDIYSIDSADIAAKKLYVSSLATAEEIAVFEGVDAAATDRIREAVDMHVLDYIEGFEDYNPKEVKKLLNAVIVQSGKYVVLCVSDDDDAARKCIKKYI